jgi:hypothetical protein
MPNVDLLRHEAGDDAQQLRGLLAAHLLDCLHAVLRVPFLQVLDERIGDLDFRIDQATLAIDARVARDKALAGRGFAYNLLGRR